MAAEQVGVIVGKFLPPHAGHQYLIDAAAARVDRLVVYVCVREDDPLPGDQRAVWLQELHPTVEIVTVVDPYPAGEDDPRLWADAVVGWLGGRPDMVFTSEDYGPPWAAALGCRHVMIDRDRRRIPCSGSAVRSDPLAHWHHLSPSVRAYYARRVVVVGAESTGTTTLAGDLAAALDTTFVAEYGREYWVSKHARGDDAWTTEEFVHIATEQFRREDEAARACNGTLVCDTDAWATSLWHERYVGHLSPAVDAVAEGHPRPALYLLTGDDIPFVQDGTRDGEHLRHWMHQRFLAELPRRGSPWRLVSGDRDQRLRTSLDMISDLGHLR